MISFKEFLNKNIIQRTTLYFAVVLIILNIGISYINVVYERVVIEQKELAFVTIIEHISEENDLQFVIEYVEHYGHIHNTAVKYFINNVIEFESELEGSNYSKYFIGDNSDYVLIDSSSSLHSELTNWLFLVTNVLFILIYIISIFIFYTYSKRKTSIILNDLEEMLFNVREKRFIESHLKFSEYQTLYDEFREMYTELINSRLLKDNQLQSITHDLKTSLTVLSIFFEGTLNNRIKLDNSSIAKLLEEVNFLNNLVESLSNEYKNNFSSISLSKLLNEITEKYESIYMTKNISLVTEIEENIIVSGDDDSFVRIIQNILSNCYFYSNEFTEVKVTLESNENIELTIIDQGIGISDIDISNVFSKNYRISSESHRNKTGSGLGLYIVKLLVEELNGKIELTSSDKGTEIKIIFHKK